MHFSVDAHTVIFKTFLGWSFRWLVVLVVVVSALMLVVVVVITTTLGMIR